MSSSKRINARIQKWRTMINEGLETDPIIVKSRIRKGIPTAVRPIVWPQIIKLNNFVDKHRHQYTFQKLINAPSKSTHEISLDIPRTFPEEEDSKILRKSLNNVLKAISIVYPKVGYCQGMNFLALRLLQIVDDEQAFWIISYLLQIDPYLMKNFIDPTLIQEESFVFKEIISQFAPAVLQRFQSQSLMIEAFTVKWFMTIFSAVLEQQMFYRIFQIYLNEGWGAIYGVALTLLKLNEAKIISNSLQQNILLINSQIFKINNANDFIQQVCKYQIPFSIIKHYASKYKEGQKQKPKIIKLQSTPENHKHNLPIPQQQGGVLPFQSKSQAVSFEVFSMLKSK